MVCCLLFVVCCLLLFVVCCLLFIVVCLLFVVCLFVFQILEQLDWFSAAVSVLRLVMLKLPHVRGQHQQVAGGTMASMFDGQHQQQQQQQPEGQQEGQQEGQCLYQQYQSHLAVSDALPDLRHLLASCRGVLERHIQRLKGQTVTQTGTQTQTQTQIEATRNKVLSDQESQAVLKLELVLMNMP